MTQFGDFGWELVRIIDAPSASYTDYHRLIVNPLIERIAIPDSRAVGGSVELRQMHANITRMFVADDLLRYRWPDGHATVYVPASMPTGGVLEAAHATAHQIAEEDVRYPHNAHVVACASP